MSLRRTVLLLHRQTRGDHHDWMLEDPQAAPTRGRLITFRASVPSQRWRRARVFDLHRLGDHRRDYLRYEGPLARDRGLVRRIDEGVYLQRLWLAVRFVVEVRMADFAGVVEAAQVKDDRWQARVIA